MSMTSKIKDFPIHDEETPQKEELDTGPTPLDVLQTTSQVCSSSSKKGQEATEDAFGVELDLPQHVSNHSNELSVLAPIEHETIVTETINVYSFVVTHADFVIIIQASQTGIFSVYMLTYSRMFLSPSLPISNSLSLFHADLNIEALNPSDVSKALLLTLRDITIKAAPIFFTFGGVFSLDQEESFRVTYAQLYRKIEHLICRSITRQLTGSAARELKEDELEVLAVHNYFLMALSDRSHIPENVMSITRDLVTATQRLMDDLYMQHNLLPLHDILCEDIFPV